MGDHVRVAGACGVQPRCQGHSAMFAISTGVPIGEQQREGCCLRQRDFLCFFCFFMRPNDVFCRVVLGSYSYLTGGSMVDRDVPPFTVVSPWPLSALEELSSATEPSRQPRWARNQVQGDRAGIRGLNEVLMRRCSFSLEEKAAIRVAFQV